MIVAVQHQLGAVRGNDAEKFGGVDQALVGRPRADRRMMQHHHAEQFFVPQLLEQRGKLAELALAEPAGSEKRCGRHTGR